MVILYEIIRGSSACSDGRTPGVTAPSCEIQTRMIQRAYDMTGLIPNDTVYVEAHGTGTTLGDRIEATALHKPLCTGKQKEKKLYIGGVKTNVGHTESVAGLVSLIKAVLMLEKKMIPPHTTFASPNSNIPLRDWGMEVPQKMLRWPEGAVRRVLVNSFGYGGTNAHTILDAAEGYLNNRKQAVALHPRPNAGEPLSCWCSSKRDAVGPG
ncbi:thiolase-like protein [Aspergillus karnatakaensis]|uniref:beta-ketoacyl [acyl carrier protein] synthase domain-containing protein n=1 Tax=Aspergillus karnatakaensis TaxID=1810916 RepID=UPI003CCE1F48